MVPILQHFYTEFSKTPQLFQFLIETKEDRTDFAGKLVIRKIHQVAITHSINPLTCVLQFCQITSLSEVGGVSKETPMAKLLHEWGIPAEFKCIS